MKESVARAWIADLRAGPKQAYEQLFDGEGHCCLGRLCLVLGHSFVHKPKGYCVAGTDERLTLPCAIEDEAEMSSPSGSFTIYHPGWINPSNNAEYSRFYLAKLNDPENPLTFDQIADTIEEFWPEL